MEHLSDEQVAAFDTEYVNDRRWLPVQRCLDRDFPEGDFSFLDIGGGNGVFADRVLAAYPNSRGAVLDNSPLLLERNTENDRKRILLEDISDLWRLNEKFDVLFFNWTLHHLVARASYAQSRRNIQNALAAARDLLTGRGRLSIYEDMYRGILVKGAPGWIIYRLTTAKTIARFVKEGGANTAGVGVCFLSGKQWRGTITRAGFVSLDVTPDTASPVPWSWKVFLHVGEIRCGHFWLQP